MNLIKRLTTSVTASIENAVGELENHDAIVDANIKQTRQAVAKAQARLTTLRQQQRNFEHQLVAANEHIKTWETRARSISGNDDHKALQCLTRRNQNEAEARRLTVAIRQQETLISRVITNLNALKSTLDEISQRHNLMRSRQAVADINQVAAKVGQIQRIDETFERWESAVLETELAATSSQCSDPLEAQFKQQENNAELQAQLARLKQEQATQKSPLK